MQENLKTKENFKQTKENRQISCARKSIFRTQKLSGGLHFKIEQADNTELSVAVATVIAGDSVSYY